MEKLIESLDDAPIIDKDGYEYLVHPISNGVPMLDPDLLREVVIEVMQTADLDVDKIVTPETMGIHLATALSALLLNTFVPGEQSPLFDAVSTDESRTRPQLTRATTER